MQSTKRYVVAALTMAVAVTLGGCRDTPVAVPTAPDGPAARSTRAAGMEGYDRNGEVRTGYIYGRSGKPLRIRYEVQGELAVWEGDIILGRARDIATSEAQLRARRATGARTAVYIDDTDRRWPGGVVPYVIDGGLPNTARVTDAIAMVEQGTAGVTFRVRTDEENYIRFQASSGCSSEIGMVGGEQAINLTSDCGAGNAAHEILHALGIFHEQSRCDRDSFVTVEWDNIIEDKKHNFDRECDDASDHDAYDEGSIMHYGTNFFAIDNTKPTLVSKRGRDNLMGQRAALGATDIATVNLLYGINNSAPTAALEVSDGPYAEGNVISFDAGGSTDPDDAVLTYSWDFGDGSCAVVPAPDKCTAERPNHGYRDEGTYTVTLTVSDGTLTAQQSVELSVENVAPFVTAGPDAGTTEGALFTRNGSFSDPGTDTWTATVNYGDGTGTVPLALTADKTFALSHQYADNGVYTITVRVDDQDGGVANDEVLMTITNVAPAVEAGPDGSVVSGSQFTLTAGFTDPGLVDMPWAWTVDWGFGSNSTGSTVVQGAAVISTSVRACAAGSYTVGVSVKDKDDGTGSDVMTLTVSHVVVAIDVMPGTSTNPVNLRKSGLLPVALLSTPTFDATRADPSRIVLGNEAGIDTPVARQNRGTYHAKREDVNGDGRPDLLLMFEVEALVANGDLTAGTTHLVLRGVLDDQCTSVRGADAVVIVP